MLITQHSIISGADPEVFIRKIGGPLVPSSAVLNKRGYIKDSYSSKPLIVRDGVQAEFHPSAASCTTVLNTDIHHCIVEWSKVLRKTGHQIDFSRTVDLSDAEFEGLSSEERQLGCQTSLNIYDSSATIGVDGSSYRKRSAGGHLHFGLDQFKTHPIWDRRADIVPILDVLLGNTAVLMDRDEGNRERRKVYGRAGEYRLPAHGLEYRTLSNFWLASFPLTNFVIQMGRAAVQVAISSLGEMTYNHSVFPAKQIVTPPQTNYAGELMALVDIEDIRRAINENDADLAWRNFERIREWIAKYFVESIENSPYPTGSFPLSPTKLADFDFFISKVDSDGIAHWFGEDPLKWWTEQFVARAEVGTSGMSDPAHSRGWNSFLLETVRPARLLVEKDQSIANLAMTNLPFASGGRVEANL